MIDNDRWFLVHLAKNKAMPTVSHAPSNYLMKKYDSLL